MDAILAVARKNNLWVVEDAACAFGSWIGDRHAGTFGNAGCFSFHPRKSITTGEGGMITTGDAELASLSRTLRDHGASRSDLARHHTKAAFLLAEYNHLGYNYRMTDIQGALGCAQMRRAGTILHERAKRAEMYDERLRGIEQLQTPMTPAGFRHGYQSYVCLYRPKLPTLENIVSLYERRNEIMTRLETQGIATRQGTHAPVLLGYYAEKYELSPSHFPNSYFADRLSLALPLFPQLTEQELDLICLKLQEALNGSPSA
jgi:dTDP-4-amino-4,6-dideoxygalactose transaminase